jgi:hypothetical protein
LRCVVVLRLDDLPGVVKRLVQRGELIGPKGRVLQRCMTYPSLGKNRGDIRPAKTTALLSGKPTARR